MVTICPALMRRTRSLPWSHTSSAPGASTFSSRAPATVTYDEFQPALTTLTLSQGHGSVTVPAGSSFPYVVVPSQPLTVSTTVTNPDTGKSKGFGFADFQDADQAASAVRNLNDYEIDGRKIRVDWPHNNEKDSVPTNYEQASVPPSDGLNAAAASALPPLPPGVDLPPNLRATDAISQTLSTLPPPQLLDVPRVHEPVAVR